VRVRQVRRIRRHDIAPILGLGVATAVMSVAFLSALKHIPIAALMATFVGATQVIPDFDWRVLPIALEPAFGVLVGLIVLHQIPSFVQWIGIGLVVLAGAAAQRSGTRTPAPELDPAPHA